LSYRAVTRDGTEIEPSAGIVPIMKEVEEDRYAVIGTGFYITRYGLFMTAAHVLSELVNWKEQKIARSRSFVCHPAGDNEVHLRRIVAITISNSVDLGSEALTRLESLVLKLVLQHQGRSSGR
jgi:hypothetical protein